MTRTSKRLTARGAARQRQAKANQDQRRREQTELEHATEFEVARMRRDDAAATVAAHEIEMARQVDTLLALGNPVVRVAELTGETDAEIKRLRKVADSRANHKNRTSASANGDPRRTPIGSLEGDAGISATAEPTPTRAERSAPTESTGGWPPEPSAGSAGPLRQDAPGSSPTGDK